MIPVTDESWIMFQLFVEALEGILIPATSGSRSQQWCPHRTHHAVELGPPWDCGLAITTAVESLNHPNLPGKVLGCPY